jgi:ornithine carbamoyltransferase
MTRHFLDLAALEPRELHHILKVAKDVKWERQHRKFSNQLAGRKLAMIFEHNSTRTRVSFEIAMAELGGYVVNLRSDELQLGRGESLADTARVLSRYVDAIMIRAKTHATLEELAANATIPVINGLTDVAHPCQVMADVLTFEEHRGDIKGKTIAWIGDGNNMANSWIAAAERFGFTLRLACPPELMPAASILERAKTAGAAIEPHASPEAAVADADAVVTDTWVSMGQTDAEKRLTLLAPFQVSSGLMAKAKSDAIFMHCLPAHRGEEVTAEVIDGQNSVVWDEAENRLHVQKAILLWCLGAV